MMNSSSIKSNSTTPGSKREKLPRAYYALLAKVGHQKRKASTYHDEAEFYCGIATELLAVLGEAVTLLQREEVTAQAKRSVSNITSAQHRLVRKLLNHWPNDSESQERIWSLLDSRGLETVLGLTPDGYVCLSPDRTLENVERIFAATRELRPSP